MIWKLLLAITINFALAIGAPYILSYYKYIYPSSHNSWVVLCITAITISIKTILGDIISGKFLYHKHGYDFCIVALGTSMSGLSLQVLNEKNLFPGLQNAPFQSFMSQHIVSNSNIAIAYLSLILVISSFATLLTARISKAIDCENPRFPDLLSIINFSIGSSLIGLYVLLIITKG